MISPKKNSKMESASLGKSNYPSIVKPLTTLMRVSGIYYSPKRSASSLSRLMQLLYCLVVNLVEWSTVIRMIWCITESDSIDVNVLMNASFAVFFGLVSTMFVFFTIASSSHLPNVINCAQNIHEKYGQPFYMRNRQLKFRKCVTACSAVIFGTTLIIIVSFFLSHEVGKGQMCLMAPLKDTEPVKFYGVMFVFLVVIGFQMMGLTGIVLALGLTCYFLGKEFSSNAERLRQLLNEKVTVTSHDTEKVRLQYEDIIHLVGKCNRLFSFTILSMYAIAVPFFCLTVFATVTETYTMVFTLQSICDIVIIASVVVALTMAGMFVTSKSQAASDAILQADFSNLNNDVATSLSMFLARLSRNQVGMSAGGLFMVDGAAFLTILGLVTTYTVVIFQFYPANGLTNRAINNTGIY